METTEIIRILRQCGECCRSSCEECPEYKKAEEGFRKDPEAVGFMWSCGGVLLDAADRLESLDKRWKITRVERDQSREMRERAERLLAQSQEELLELRRNTEPVVHAHWERFKYPSGTHGIRCSHCKTTNGRKSKRCPDCGAHMGEEVAE